MGLSTAQAFPKGKDDFRGPWDTLEKDFSGPETPICGYRAQRSAP